MKPETNIFVLSDNHFNHWNINNLCDRGFKNVVHMNQSMIDRWNQVVKPDDMVINVGDIVYTQGSSDEIANIISVLNGRKILVIGNHDRKTYSWYINNGFDFVCESMTWNYNGKKILFIHNPHEVEPVDYNRYHYVIHGHQHNHSPFIRRNRGCLFINVSVEQIKYTPLSLMTLLNRIKQGQYKVEQA